MLQPKFFTIDPSITESMSPYASGDCIGGIITLSDASTFHNYPLFLRSVCVREDGGNSPPLSILLFRATPTGGTYTDNATLVLSSTDDANLSGLVEVVNSDYYTAGGKAMAVISSLDQVIAVDDRDLFMLVVANGAYTPSATDDLLITLGFERG